MLTQISTGVGLADSMPNVNLVRAALVETQVTCLEYRLEWYGDDYAALEVSGNTRLTLSPASTPDRTSTRVGLRKPTSTFL